jgi:general stress protein 26
MRLAPLLVALLIAPPALADAGRAAVLDAARALAADDPYPTLVTVDGRGRPRARTVEASAIEANDAGDIVVWIGTNPDSRKVAQLRAHPAATLHWADDDAGTYVSLMGTATLHDDAPTVAAHTFNAPESLDAFWPDWPEDYLLIRVLAERIEVLGGGLEPDADTWAPAGADVD